VILGWLDWLTGAGRQRARLLRTLAGRVMPALPQWQGLSAAERDKLTTWAVDFCQQKIWEGCQGLTVVDEMKMLISAQAGMLVLGWDEPFYFPDVRTVLIYPDQFVAPHRMSIGSGMHIESRTRLEGQAWYRGPVIISWSDVVEPGRATAHNLVVHEFSHQLDMFNGGNADGIPPVADESRAAWVDAMQRAMEELKHSCEFGQDSVLDCYGCESPAEFFAVSSEAFFESPQQLSVEYSEWFDQLKNFYRTDPRRWLAYP
jgi:MtfA peptidase